MFDNKHRAFGIGGEAPHKAKKEMDMAGITRRGGRLMVLRLMVLRLIIT